MLGVEFAPIFIPLERRLQTFATFVWISPAVLGVTLYPLLLTYLLFTKLWPLTILYAAWMVYDRRTPFYDGRKSTWFRHARIWKNFCDYFPINLVKTSELPPDGNYLFCVFPHGIFSAGASANFQSNANDFDSLYPGLDTYLLTSSASYNLPIGRELLLAIGCCAATKETILRRLTGPPGTSCVLIIGGTAEALLAQPGTYTIVVKNRKGFVKVALKAGASLVPVFSFGENDIYDQVRGKWLLRFQNFVRARVNFSPCLIKGRGFFQYSFGVLPHRRPITTVVGGPIKLPKIENPPVETINEYHAIFVDELKKLFESHKGFFHENEAELIVT